MLIPGVSGASATILHTGLIEEQRPAEHVRWVEPPARGVIS